ncbi:MAG TPA: TetR/AcrR family transcriptional regulator [Pelomicrobium sp.]|nr:TetR/AcrR family transcriptional regulator [Pelomicrobium sp.]
MAGRAERTRGRILDASLALFNVQGEPNVSTNQIALEAGISPGNLHYHYRHKERIVAELFDRFEASLREILGAPAAGVTVEDVWLFLHVLFEHVRDYRFLFRDLDDILERDRRLRARFTQLFDDVVAAFGGLCRALAAERAMSASESQIAAVSENMALIAIHWLGYERLRGRGDDSDAIGRGVYHAMAHVAPYLKGESRALLERLGRAYAD